MNSPLSANYHWYSPAVEQGALPVLPVRDRKIVDLPNHRDRATMTELYFEWTSPVECRLNEICALPFGWDGYRGRPTRWDTASFTYALLRRICRPTTPAPDIVPLPSGGLQIEWHTSTSDVQFIVYAPYKVQAWKASVDPDDEGVEFPLTNDYTEVLPWIDALG